MILDIGKAEKTELEEILQLQYLSYQSEAELYDDFAIPPLRQTIADLEEEFSNQIILKAVVDNRIIGSVRAYIEQDECKIGKLMVHPDFQNRGIGAMLMNEIELRFFHCKKFVLFTGAKSTKNLYLYNKLGYRITDEKQVNEQLTLFCLEKKSNQ